MSIKFNKYEIDNLNKEIEFMEIQHNIIIEKKNSLFHTKIKQ